MKYLLVIGIYFISQTCFGQERGGFHVNYNVYTEQISYERNGKVIKKPKVKKGENIYIHLNEFNDYAFSADLKYNEKEISPSSDFFSSNPLGSSFNFSPSNKGFSFNSPKINNTSLEGFDTEIKNLKTRGEESAMLVSYLQQMHTIKSDLAVIESEMIDEMQVLKRINQSGVVRGIAGSEVNNLKTNTRIKPSRIKELTQEYISTAFGINDDREINLNDVIDRMDLSDEYETSRKMVDQNLSKYISLNDKLIRLYHEVELNSDDSQSFTFLSNQIQNQNDHNKENIDNISSTLGDINHYSGASNTQVETLTELKNQYEEIIRNDFIFSFPPIPAKSDEINFKVSIKARNTKEELKFFEQTVPVGGGLKINAGFGLTFGKYLDERFQYGIIDSVLVATEIDQFVPLLASFIHAYAMPVSDVSIGGSFGVGIPINASNNLQSATFFLGPSLIIGKNDRMILTTGVMGGKVERLANEFEIGDTYISQGNEVPSIQSYELGWFIGISYNIFGN